MNKKIFLLVIALIGFGFSAYATSTSCTVRNSTQPNATVVGSIVEVEGNRAYVVFSSDESVKSVNVQFTIQNANTGGSTIGRGSAVIPPNQERRVPVNLGPAHAVNAANWHSWRLTITSARCN